MCFDVVHEAKRGKLNVEEKKIDVEIEEPKMAILGRSKMIDVFESLDNNLK